ncbi:ABC transporter substrate-binding protein [Dactylosporangium cerinum]|uniref:Probable sugar-binding periplasmic protein n=1 Tax=Dactylosporangium cerinum TaxID=1434730 RepID=A0ABV9VJJ0_9ACTN
MGLSRRNLLIAGGLTIGLSACSVTGDGTADDGSGKVEVFSWWAGPGEKEGLEALVADFRQRNPGIEFDNAAVAGGAGTIARTVLATRLENNDPPDSYQVHAGLELDSDIEAGYVEDIRYLYDQQHWRDRLPKGLVEALTFDGKIYSVPVNIHRANLLWHNPALLKARGLTPPTSWAQFLTQAATLKAAGILPLSIGPAWTQKHLLECVLLGELGADGYTGLWNGTTDWKAAATQEALALFVRVLDQSDIATAAGDWQPALDKVVAGTAAYNVMGDWADAYLRTKGLVFQEGYSVAASPGSDKVYDFLSDSFTLPKGAPRRRAAEQWLIECGSVSGQDAFNPQKGSVPARLDADKAKYTGYLALAIAEWTDSATRVVGSLTHGVVAGTVRSAAVDAALALFVQDRDTMKFAAAAGG